MRITIQKDSDSEEVRGIQTRISEGFRWDCQRKTKGLPKGFLGECQKANEQQPESTVRRMSRGF